MDTLKICPKCRKPLAADAPMGLCPECLLKSGFPTGTEPGGPESGFVPPTVEEITRLFPQLEILGFLGKGGMGAVYKARQPALDRLVALKVLPPTVGNDPGFAERFSREARALARLNHPNIVTVHDFGQAGPLPYLIMELVDGANLRELEQAGHLTPQQALAIVPQICDALQFAHGEGIVHRDIKPENLLIDKKGRVKITDFGIAKILGAPEGRISLTGAKDIVGTPHYMAPEQIEQPQTVDHRADIYSLGVVFYEMLTGELPLGKFQPPSQKVQIDVRLDEVVLRTLEKEPQRRYQHASDVKTRVETIAGTPGRIGTMPGSSALPVAMTDKAILPAFLLALFFGVFGAHRFYVGKFKTACVQLGMVVALIPLIVFIAQGGPQPFLGLLLGAVVTASGVWAFIDCILLVCKAFTDARGIRMTEWIHSLDGRPPVTASRRPVSTATPLQGNYNLIIAPAVALMVAGAFKVFAGLKGLVFMGGLAGGLVSRIFSELGLNFHSWGAYAFFTAIVFGIIPAIVAIYGAVQMFQIRNYAWAVAAAIVSICLCGFLGFAAGVWALVILLRNDVRMTFESQPNAGLPPSRLGWPWILGGTSALLLFILLVNLGLAVATKHRVAAAGHSATVSPFGFLPNLVQTVSGDYGDDTSDDSSDDAGAVSVTSVVDGTTNVVYAGAATTFTQTLDVGPEGKFIINADRGDIRVTATNGNVVKIKVTRRVKRADDQMAAKLLKQEHLTLKHHDDEISLTTTSPDILNHLSFNRPDLEVHYEVTVPEKFSTHFETLGGTITVTGVQGGSYVRTAGGDLKLDDVAGTVDGETMGGDIHVQKCAGSLVHLKTMGGSVSVDFTKMPRIDSGLHTMGGNIVVRVPETSSFKVDAHTLGGSVSSDLPVSVAGQLHDNRLQGKVNGGGALLTLETFGGNIELLKNQ